MKRGPGRPATGRKVALSVFVSADEKARLLELAKAESRSISQLVAHRLRQMLLAEAREMERKAGA